jgi:predicted nucleic acid-binding protein
LLRNDAGGFITTEEYGGLLTDLLHDARERYRLVPVSPALISGAIRPTRQHRLRGYDAIHLACALSLNATLTAGNAAELIFVAADANLLAAAQAEGLATENPTERA